MKLVGQPLDFEETKKPHWKMRKAPHRSLSPIFHAPTVAYSTVIQWPSFAGRKKRFEIEEVSFFFEEGEDDVNEGKEKNKFVL